MISLCVKVLELQDHVSRLQTLNSERQSQLSQIEKSERDTDDKEDKDRKKQLQRDEVVHKVMAAKLLFFCLVFLGLPKEYMSCHLLVMFLPEYVHI